MAGDYSEADSALRARVLRNRPISALDEVTAVLTETLPPGAWYLPPTLLGRGTVPVLHTANVTEELLAAAQSACPAGIRLAGVLVEQLPDDGVVG